MINFSHIVKSVLGQSPQSTEQGEEVQGKSLLSDRSFKLNTKDLDLARSSYSKATQDADYERYGKIVSGNLR